MNACYRALLSLLALFVLALGQPASATYSHGPYVSSNVNYSIIDETTQSGFGTADPEPLLGAMATSGDTLSWSPTMFHATASGSFDFDEDKSNLEVWMTALTPGALDLITLNEAGQVNLSGGTNGTNATLSMSGQLTVTAGGTDYIFTFSSGGGDVTSVFNVPTLLTADVNPGVTNFTGSAVFDVVALLAGQGEFASATKAVLTWDDSLIVASESGTTADAWKTSAQIVVVPEPATAGLLVLGLVALGIRARRRCV